MNILFRVDAGGEIGLGHYYRSMNLANSLFLRGHKIYFVHKKSDFWSSVNINFEHTSISTEREQLKLIDKLNIDWFYVDAILDFTEQFFHSIKSIHNCRIMFYQNISDSRHHCDYYVLPSIHQQPTFFKNFSANQKIYQGLEYFTFNEKLKFISKKTEVAKEIRKIAVVSGGSDPKNILKKLHIFFNKLNFGNIEFNYFYGNNYMFKNQLPTNREDNNFIPFELNDIMKNDMVVSSFGVSIYEFMALKMPVVGIGHQTSNALACDYLAEKCFLFSLGNIDILSEENLFNVMDRAINDFHLRDAHVQKASQNIDLQGVERLINILENE